MMGLIINPNQISPSSSSPGPFPSAASSFLARGRRKQLDLHFDPSGGKVTQASVLNPPRGQCKSSLLWFSTWIFSYHLDSRVLPIDFSGCTLVRRVCNYPDSSSSAFQFLNSFRFYTLLNLWSELGSLGGCWVIIWTFFWDLFFLYSTKSCTRVVL
jgi:hypothetical protein